MGLSGRPLNPLYLMTTTAQELAKVVGAVLIAWPCDQKGAEEFLGLFKSAD